MRALQVDLDDACERGIPGARAVALVDERRDGQILDGEAGRVEHGDLVAPCAACRFAREDAAELDDAVAPERPSFDRARDVSVVAGLLSLVDHHPDAGQLLDCHLRLPGAVGAHQADVLARVGREGAKLYPGSWSDWCGRGPSGRDRLAAH